MAEGRGTDVSGHRNPLGAEWYLGSFFIAVVAYQVAEVLMEATGAAFDPFPRFVIIAAGTAVSVALWWRYEPGGGSSRLALAFIAIMASLWALNVALAHGRSEATTPYVVVLPLLLALVGLKPPTSGAALRSGDALAWALIGASVLTLTLEMGSILPSWYAGSVDAAFVAGDRAEYWLPFADVLGIDGRWAGPFRHPNLAGPVGAFLLVFGMARSGARRVVFALAGTLILTLTASRTAMVSAAAGLFVVALIWWLQRPSRLPLWPRIVLAALPVLGLIGYWTRLNPGMSGRTTVWPEFVELAKTSPVLGVGAEGIQGDIAAGTLPSWAIHAHDVPLDALVRTGAVGLALTLALLVVALVAGWCAVRRGSPSGLALSVMVAVGGLTETTVRWSEFSNTLGILLLGVLISTGSTSSDVQANATSRSLGGSLREGS